MCFALQIAVCCWFLQGVSCQMQAGTVMLRRFSFPAFSCAPSTMKSFTGSVLWSVVWGELTWNSWETLEPSSSRCSFSVLLHQKLELKIRRCLFYTNPWIFSFWVGSTVQWIKKLSVLLSCVISWMIRVVQQSLFSQGFLHVRNCSVLDFAEVLFTTKRIWQIQMQTI